MIFPTRLRASKDSAQTVIGEAEAIPFPESWYALAISSSLKAGHRRPIRFIGREWVLFRDAHGKAGLIARHCPHMGADLSEGCVHGRNLVCPVHQWGFTAEGACTANIPPSQSEAANLPSLAVEEWAGILFAFAAPAAAYGLPRDLLPARARFGRAKRNPFPFHWLLPALNTFDLSHFSRVHHREFIRQPEITSGHADHLAIRFSARVLTRRLRDKVFNVLGFGTVDVSIDCWGGSLLIMRNHTTRVGAVIGVEPIGNFQSCLYMTTFGMDEAEGLSARALRPLQLEFGRIAMTSFLRADIPVLKGMWPREGVLIPGRDDGAIRFWAHFKGLPKAGE